MKVMGKRESTGWMGADGLIHVGTTYIMADGTIQIREVKKKRGHKGLVGILGVKDELFKGRRPCKRKELK
jgi:hypothetical protein